MATSSAGITPAVVSQVWIGLVPLKGDGIGEGCSGLSQMIPPDRQAPYLGSVWIENQKVLGVTPRPELAPFFDVRDEEQSNVVLQWRPRPDSNRRSSA